MRFPAELVEEECVSAVKSLLANPERFYPMKCAKEALIKSSYGVWTVYFPPYSVPIP